MPRHTEKQPKTVGNKMLTRAAAAAAAASVSSEDRASARATTPTDACPPRPEPASSPAKCAICLGDLANRCYTNSCIHQFCFGCLLEWSKIKAECPLCKSNFQSIYHNIRSNHDYDEYQIPPTNGIPHLSIRLTTDGYRTLLPVSIPNSYYDHSHLPTSSAPHFHRVGPLGPTSPFHDHGYSFHRMVRERERSDRQNSYIRILEVGPVSEPSALDFMSYSSGGSGRQALDNPFYEEEQELFGSINDNASAAATDPGLRGYRDRKRIYARGQFVSPFRGTLPAGTVFFPSVEYFRTHPSSFARVKAWLFREIMVLMGINRSRTEMGYVFDVILGLLLRYDIRSREFREMINVYMEPRTRHFQHEFYHFLLAGMNMEEYDRVARYTNPSTTTVTSTTTSSSTVTASSSSTSTSLSTSRTGSGVPGNSRVEASSIPCVTISDSSSDDSSDSDSVEHLDVVGSSNQRNEGESQPREREIPSTRSNVGHMAELTRLYHQMTDRENEIMAQLDRFQGMQRGRVTSGRPAGMSPPHSPPTRGDGGWSSWASPLSQQPPRAHTNNAPPSSMTSTRDGADLGGWESAINDLSRYRPVRESRSGLGAYESDYSRPMVNLDQEVPTSDLDRPRCPVESGYPALPTFPEPTTARPERTSQRRPHHNMSCIFGPGRGASLECLNHPHRPFPGSPGYVRRVSSHADPVTNMNPDGTPRRSTGLQVLPIEPSSRASFVENIKKFRAGLCKVPPAPPPVPVPEDDDEIEMLGIHPVIKPPPLAVITLSSDDEEGNPKKPKVEKEEIRIGSTAPGGGSSISTGGRWTGPSSTLTRPEVETEVIELGDENSRSRSDSSSLSFPTPPPQNDGEWEMPRRSGFAEFGTRLTLRRKRDQGPSGSKRTKKKAKYASVEFLSSSEDSDSSSSSSDSDVSVEEVVEKKGKRKQRKEKKKSRCSKPSSQSETPAGPSHKSSSSGKKKKSHRHHRKYKKCPRAPFLSLATNHGASGQVGSATGEFPASSSHSFSFSTRVRLPVSDSDSDEPPTTTRLRFSSIADCLETDPVPPLVSSSNPTEGSTIPGIGILDLRKLLEERKESQRGTGTGNTAAPPTAVIRPSQLDGASRWESDEETGMNSYLNFRDGNVRGLEEDDLNQDPDAVEDDETSSSQDDTRENGGITPGDRGRQGSFFIPNPLTTASRSFIREPMLGEYFQGHCEIYTPVGLMDFPLDDETADGPPWRFAHEPPSESAELLDLSIGALHSPGHYEDENPETLNQRENADGDGGEGEGSGSEFYSPSNEHAWLGDY